VETHRNSRLRVVSAKIELFFTPTVFLLARHTQSPLDDRRAQAHPAYFRFDCWRWPVGLARRERPPKSSSSHPSTGVGARAVSTYGRPRLPQGLPRLHRRGSRRRWGPAREGPGPTLVHQVLYHRLLGSSYGHGRRVEAAGCRLPGLSPCRIEAPDRGGSHPGGRPPHVFRH